MSKLGCQPASPVGWKIQLPARCLPAGFEAALQTFFNQGAERGTLLPGDAPGLFYQLVRKLNGGLHTVYPYLSYGLTVLLVFSARKAAARNMAAPLIVLPETRKTSSALCLRDIASDS